SNAQKFNQIFNNLINIKIDSVLTSYEKDEVLISYHKIGKKSIVPIYFTSSENKKTESKVVIDSILYDGSIIKRIGTEKKYKFVTKKNNVTIESESKLLVENTIRKSNHVFKEKVSDLKKLYNISNSKIALFISNDFKNYIENKELFSLFNINKLSNWIQYDIDLNQNGITLNGLAFQNDSIPKEISYLNGIKPSKSNFINIIPNNFSDFQRTSFNYYKYLENFEKNESIKKINEFKKDSILFEIDEFGLLKNKLDSIILVNFEDKLFLNNKILKNSENNYSYRDIKIHKLRNQIIDYQHLKFINYKLKQNYASIIENKLVISNSKNSLEKIIINISNSSTIKNENKFSQSFENIPEKSNYLKVYNLKNSKEKTLESLNISNKKFPFMINHTRLDDNIIYNSFSVIKSIEENKKNGINLDYSFKTDNPINLTPKFVTNYVTKKKEIITQDINNILYLISLDGKLIWKENIGSKIIGEIHQIDLYKNGRLQYAFNTDSDFQIIDKNGNQVKKIKNKNTLGLTVFDYDKLKNYRFLLFDNEIKILDSKMKNVKGFIKKNIIGIQKNNPKHFRIGKKDYLIFNSNNKLKITDRRGNIRIKNNLINIENEIFLNQNSFTTIDSKNNVVKINTKGEIIKKPLPSESKYLFSADKNNLVHISENILTINGKVSELEFANYTKPIIFNNKLIDNISLTDKDQKLIYLFDSNSNLVPNFPVFGSSKIDLFEDKNSRKYITSVGESDEILVYSLY
ncbi:MAG: hypothetical protein HN629_01430, partial [Flavobacteriaceae bacterium]|nr:hypothetical protein [Flavobacteriaceae bacterium]